MVIQKLHSAIATFELVWKGTAGRQHTCAVTTRAFQASPRRKGKGVACALNRV
jgi:hypothetical protein